MTILRRLQMDFLSSFLLGTILGGILATAAPAAGCLQQNFVVLVPSEPHQKFWLALDHVDNHLLVSVDGSEVFQLPNSNGNPDIPPIMLEDYFKAGRPEHVVEIVGWNGAYQGHDRNPGKMIYELMYRAASGTEATAWWTVECNDPHWSKTNSEHEFMRHTYFYRRGSP